MRGVPASRALLRIGVLALMLAAGGCASGSSASGPASTARVYIQAVLSRDGRTLCPLLDTATRRSVGSVVARAKTDPTYRGRPDCPHVMHLLIGYPHENMGYRFMGGKLLSVGRSRAVTVGGHRYVGVEVRVSLRTDPNGSYAPMGKPVPSPTVTDTVWLARSTRGWRTAKPSLTLMAALNGDILSDSRLNRGYARQAVQPPVH
jgi:hypothetical protein